MKNEEFHQPFLSSLVFIAACTLISMILAPVFIESYISLSRKNQQFTTHKSQDHLDTKDNYLIRSNIE